jgi:ABC-type uncharacterized transport system permease subunit
MAVDLGTIDHLTQVISQVVAPSFLLGAVASFVSLISTRMTNVVDRLRSVNAIPEEGHVQSKLRADIPRLHRRITLLNRAVLLSISGGVVAALLMIVAFANAMIGLSHAWGAAILFIISLALLCAALVVFAYEVTIAYTAYDQHAV